MKAKVSRIPILLDDIEIGEMVYIENINGPPDFGSCWAVACPNTATDETFSGMHFCTSHFDRFYSTESFAIEDK